MSPLPVSKINENEPYKMKKSLSVLFAALSLAAGAAYADGAVYYPVPAYVAPAPVVFVPAQPVSQWYFGAGAGQSQFQNTDSANSLARTGQAGAGQVQDTDNAWKAFLGYRFNRNFAVEAGYTDLGQVQAQNAGTVATGTAKGWGGDAVGILPIARGVNLFAKVGAFRWTADATTSNAGIVQTSSNASGTSAKFGAGADFRLSRNFGIRAEYERYKNVGDQNITGRSDIDLGSISGVFHF